MVLVAFCLCLAALHPADGPDVDVRILIGRQHVTFTVLMNLAYIDEIVDTPRRDATELHTDEYQAYRDDLFAFLSETNRVALDGIAVRPLCKSFEVGEPDLTQLPLYPRMGKRALIKVRMVLVYPAKTAPRSVGMVWGEFPPDLALGLGEQSPPLTVRAELKARGLGGPIEFTADEPEYIWQDSGESLVDRFDAVPDVREPARIEVPLVSVALWVAGLIGAATAALRRRWRWGLVALSLVACGGVTTGVARASVPDPLEPGIPLPSEAEARAIFRPLHANIYRAFDYTDESEIYDALARSVHGDLLDRLYQQIYTGLTMREEGGAVSQVQEVRPLDVVVESIGASPADDTQGFVVRARWQVDGVVSHWGHSHSRTQEYSARYTVAQVGKAWRIRDNEVLEQRVVSTSSTDPGANTAPDKKR